MPHVRAKLITLAVLTAGGIGAVASLADLADEPKVSEVAAAAQGQGQLDATAAMARTVDGIGFPNWSRWGWKPLDGRTDKFADGRIGATVHYRKGKNSIAYTIVSGTEDVNNDLGTRSFSRTPPEGKVGLDVGVLPANIKSGERCVEDRCSYDLSAAAITVKRRLRNSHVILTAWPPSDALQTEATDMALRTKP